MSVYRRSFKGSKGQAARCSGHTIEFTDHRSQKRRLPTGIESKQLARAFETRVRVLVDHRKAGEPITDTLKRWLEGLAPEIRDRLVEWDIISGARARTMSPLSTLLQAWKDSLATTCTSKAHVRDVHLRAKRVLEHTGAAFWNQIDPERVMQACFEIGRATQTKKHYWVAVAQACKWIAEKHLKLGRGSSPLDQHRPKWKPTESDEEHDHPRRPLTTDEVDRLLAAASRGKPVGRGIHKISGPTRRLIYWLVIETGLRRNEVCTLTRGSLNLDSLPYCVKVRATRAKSRKERIIPIRKELAAALRDFLDANIGAPGEFVFPLYRNTARALRADLDEAKIPYRHPDTGAYADFHALRHTYITNLVKVTDIETARDLAGHSNIATTARYLHTNKAEQIRAIHALPRVASA